MKNPLTTGTIQQALEWAYDKAVNGNVPGLDNAQQMALSYMAKNGSPENQANALIRWQNTKAGTSGFVTGLGGAFTLPIAIPANITSVLYIQIRMIAAIAHMGGYDLRNDQVKTMVYACLCGNAASEVLKTAGVKIGTKLTEQAIKNISGAVLTKINQAVGFRLLTKFGSKGAINLVKLIPVAGGIIGGTFDSIATNIIGNVARATFIESVTVE
ncbi:EcsC family protein [Enterobacter sp. A11]|uniref:EcsC family protein n=1 Tax=unclassified Enterobacter TaxID=2608935 RepID=UPI00106FC3BB|nr:MULTISPECIES: EcsC family protein [unclassified Enterobacter]MBM1020230.1 EcsC family protein [Enterobacter sp. E1]MEA3561531.1 EcsC family protein [Enterobacter sp. GM-22]MEA3595173.1 EcsC family protein [Enterobacter sp. GM-31]TFF60311.1 EcsC family protein [Enterobacter sp. A11]